MLYEVRRNMKSKMVALTGNKYKLWPMSEMHVISYYYYSYWRRDYNPSGYFHGYKRWNLVAIRYTSWDISLFNMHFRFMAAIFKFHWPWRHPLFKLVALCCPTGHSRWNFVGIVYASRDIRDFQYTSFKWPPSFIYDIPKRRTVFQLVSPCCLTPITWAQPLVCSCYCEYERYTLFPIYFGEWPPSLNYDIPIHRTLFLLFLPCCPTPKTWIGL